MALAILYHVLKTYFCCIMTYVIVNVCIQGMRMHKMNGKVRGKVSLLSLLYLTQFL